MNIHQFHPDFASGDAISNEMVNIKTFLNESGYSSEIFACHYNKFHNSEIKNYKKYKIFTNPNNILIIHYSIASEAFDEILKFPDKKILLYHNSTPAHFFDGYSPRHQLLLSKADDDLQKFVDKVVLVLAVSEFNCNKLRSLGFKNPVVLPFIFDFRKFEITPNTKIIKKYKDGYTNLLFVGRIAPNKKLEDLIGVFYYYKKSINTQSRLILVGNYLDMEVYYDKLLTLIEKLKLKDIIITGLVNDRDLIAYYNVADLFITMSEHEGFCVPLIEAMYFELPIIAYKSTAVEETLQDAGILITEKNHLKIAELINLVMSNQILKNKIIKKQLENLSFFDSNNSKEKLRLFLSRI